MCHTHHRTVHRIKEATAFLPVDLTSGRISSSWQRPFWRRRVACRGARPRGRCPSGRWCTRGRRDLLKKKNNIIYVSLIRIYRTFQDWMTLVEIVVNAHDPARIVFRHQFKITLNRSKTVSNDETQKGKSRSKTHPDTLKVSLGFTRGGGYVPVE